VAAPRVGVAGAPFSGRGAVQIGDVFLGKDVVELGVHRFSWERGLAMRPKLGVSGLAAIGQLPDLSP
jgi:hypothetical protein